MKNYPPIEGLAYFSQKNRLLTALVFILCIVISIISGHLWQTSINTSFMLEFLEGPDDLWMAFFANESSKDLFTIIVKIVATPLGTVLWLTFLFLVFIALLFFISGVFKTERFNSFFFNLVSASYFGLILVTSTNILKILNVSTFPTFRILIYVAIIIYYILILNRVYKINVKKSIFSTILSLFLIFPLGGFPILMPYLSGM